jgi:hypothetical protein
MNLDSSKWVIIGAFSHSYDERCQLGVRGNVDCAHIDRFRARKQLGKFPTGQDGSVSSSVYIPFMNCTDIGGIK